MGDVNQTLKRLKIHLLLLTGSGIFVSVCAIINYFGSSESWAVDTGNDVAIMVFYISDIGIQTFCGIFMSCWQIDVIDNFGY